MLHIRASKNGGHTSLLSAETQLVSTDFCSAIAS